MLFCCAKKKVSSFPNNGTSSQSGTSGTSQVVDSDDFTHATKKIGERKNIHQKLSNELQHFQSEKLHDDRK